MASFHTLTAIAFLLSLSAASATSCPPSPSSTVTASPPPPPSSGAMPPQDIKFLSARLISAINHTEKFVAKLRKVPGGCPCSVACSGWSAYGSAADEMKKALDMVIAGNLGEANVRFSGMSAYSGSCGDCFDMVEGGDTEQCSDLRRFNRWYHKLLDDCFKYGGGM